MSDKVDIRFATQSDFRTVRLTDPHSKYIDPDKIRRKIEGKEVILAFIGKESIGIIKFSYFWATRPYLDLIFIKEEHRKSGVGIKLLDFLESYLLENGYCYLMSSSEEEEKEAKAWHRKRGFREIGKLVEINVPDSDVSEVFFIKRLECDQKADKLLEYPVL